jgi:hypothetical protein
MSEPKVIATQEFEWKIDWNEHKLSEKVFSDSFTMTCPNGDKNNPTESKWRVLFFPNGNRTSQTVSCFLECLSVDVIDHICVTFHVSVANTLDRSINVTTSSTLN